MSHTEYGTKVFVGDVANKVHLLSASYAKVNCRERARARAGRRDFAPESGKSWCCRVSAFGRYALTTIFLLLVCSTCPSMVNLPRFSRIHHGPRTL